MKIEMGVRRALGFVLAGIQNGRYEAAAAILTEVLTKLEGEEETEVEAGRGLVQAAGDAGEAEGGG